MSSVDYKTHLEGVARYNDRYSTFYTWMKDGKHGARISKENPYVYLVDSRLNESTLEIRRYLGPGNLDNKLEELEKEIKNPDSNIQTRLVIVNTRQQHLSSDLIEMLSIAYDIEPQYFLSVVAEYDQYRSNEVKLENRAFVRAIPQYNADFLHLELIEPPGWVWEHHHAWIKIAKQTNKPLNIVIIFLSMKADRFANPQARTALRPSDRSRDANRVDIKPNKPYDLLTQILTFLEELNILSKEEIDDANATPIKYIRPLIQGFEVMYSKAIRRLEVKHQLWLLLTSTERTSSKDDELYERWRDERLCLENTMSMIREVERYMKRKSIILSPGDALKDSLMHIGFLLEEGRSLEAHVKEQLDLHVNSLALKDSRESIEESKLSIKQASTTNRFTVLAFFFIPLSLVTSFFGMNIKEINGSGASWKAFLGAAVGLTVLTLISWVSWVSLNSLRETYKTLKLQALQDSQNTSPDIEKGEIKVGKIIISQARTKLKLFGRQVITSHEPAELNSYKNYLKAEDEEGKIKKA